MFMMQFDEQTKSTERNPRAKPLEKVLGTKLEVFSAGRENHQDGGAEAWLCNKKNKKNLSCKMHKQSHVPKAKPKL